MGLAETSPEPWTAALHDAFRAGVLDSGFPCLGAAAAVRRDDYAFGSFGDLGSAEAASRTAEDLGEFMSARPAIEHPVSVFVAAFAGPEQLDDPRFEDCLFRHLALMHGADPLPGVSDPSTPGEDHDPGWVFAGRHLFVVGMHPHSSRSARAFRAPLLVFNALSHVEPLRRAGMFERMSTIIRRRDERLQGCPNPAIDLPRRAQFSGRANEDGWRCPVGFDQPNHG